MSSFTKAREWILPLEKYSTSAETMNRKKLLEKITWHRVHLLQYLYIAQCISR